MVPLPETKETHRLCNVLFGLLVEAPAIHGIRCGDRELLGLTDVQVNIEPTAGGQRIATFVDYALLCNNRPATVWNMQHDQWRILTGDKTLALCLAFTMESLGLVAHMGDAVRSYQNSV